MLRFTVDTAVGGDSSILEPLYTKFYSQPEFIRWTYTSHTGEEHTHEIIGRLSCYVDLETGRSDQFIDCPHIMTNARIQNRTTGSANFKTFFTAVQVSNSVSKIGLFAGGASKPASSTPALILGIARTTSLL